MGICLQRGQAQVNQRLCLQAVSLCSSLLSQLVLPASVVLVSSLSCPLILALPVKLHSRPLACPPVAGLVQPIAAACFGSSIALSDAVCAPNSSRTLVCTLPGQICAAYKRLQLVRHRLAGAVRQLLPQRRCPAPSTAFCRTRSPEADRLLTWLAAVSNSFTSIVYSTSHTGTGLLACSFALRLHGRSPTSSSAPARRTSANLTSRPARHTTA
jgi:hypothetical protein